MKKIIFVCTGNTCRSPMAMFLFNKIAKEAAEQTWSVRTLQRNISSQYYHRLLKSQNKELVESEMKTLTIGDTTYEIVDETAREQAAAAVKTINGNEPDENGNVEVESGSVGDFGQYGLGETANIVEIPSDYALGDLKKSGWYTVRLSYGTVDFGDGYTANKFLLRVETGESEQYTSVTKQTAIFASYPGAEEYFRYCKNGYDWTAWQSAKASGGGVSRVLLWENADTSSEFPSQTIQLNDLPYYDAIEVVYTGGGYPGGYGRCYLSSGVLPKITDAMDTYYYTDGYALHSVADAYYPDVWRYFRPFTWAGAQVTFSDCTAVGTYGDSETDNYYNIPARIYGIKGVESL